MNTHATRKTLHPLEGDHILEAKEVRYELASADSGKVIVDTNMENLKGQINSMMERITDYNGENKWKCTVCEKIIKFQRDMGCHIETHIEGVSYPCHLCGSVKRSSNALCIHIQENHKITNE